MRQQRKIRQYDAIFLGCFLAVLLFLILNLFTYQSTLLVYLVIILILEVLLFFTLSDQKFRIFTADIWTLGILSILLYPIYDFFLAERFGLVTYLTRDIKIGATPLYILLYWLFGILLFGYCYLRISAIAKKEWAGGLAAGLLAATSTLVVENLFNAMGFYTNSPGSIMLWKIPLYVPLGYFMVFSAMPLLTRKKYLFGPFLYGLTGVIWVVLSQFL